MLHLTLIALLLAATPDQVQAREVHHQHSPFVARAPRLSSHAFDPRRGKVSLEVYSHTPRTGSGVHLARRDGNDRTLYEGLGWEQSGGSYSAAIEVGGKTFYLSVDTASSDLLLASTLCTTTACSALTGSKPVAAIDPDGTGSTPWAELYNVRNARSFQAVNGNQTAFGVGFADGTIASGFVARENVSWGGIIGLQVGRMGSPSQAFGVINSTNITLASQKISGVLGLGFPRLSTISNLLGEEVAPPVLASLAGNGSLAYPMFGLHLERTAIMGGSLTLGAIDSLIVSDQSSIQWHPVVKFPPYNGAPPANYTSPFLQWSLVLTKVSMNGTHIKLNQTIYEETRNETRALLDSGASGIFGPIEDVAALFALVDGSRMVSDGQWIAPCETRMTMEFSFGGRTYTLQPSDWLIGRVSTNTAECYAWPVALPPSGDGLAWQLGTPFLRAVYSIYYLGINGLQDPLIGLMNLRNSSLSESPSAVSSLLDTYPQITTVLPNALLPTPTYSRPPYLFNTTAFYSFDNASSATRTSIIPIPTQGLGNSTYAPLAIDTGGKVTTLGGGQTPLPTAQRATLDARQSVELLSQRSSVLAAATATWISGANHPNGACERISGGISAPVVLAGLFACALVARAL